MAWIGPLIGAVGGIAGNVLSNSSSESVASDNRLTSIELANTAHQREVSDLQAAGLNPILSAFRGGAPVPQFSMPSFVSPFSGVAQNAMDIFKGIAEEANTRERTKETKQNIRIKEPLSKVGDEASKGIDFIKEGVKGAVEGALGSIFDYSLSKPVDQLKLKAGGLMDDVRESLRKGAEGVSATGARGLESLGDAARRFSDSASDVIRLPGKVIGAQVNSARDYFDSATAARQRPKILDQTVGRNRYRMDENAFTGDRKTDLANIAKIQDPVSRGAVRQAYRLWQDNFPNKVR